MNPETRIPQKTELYFAAMALLCVASIRLQAAQLVNGDFQTGDFTGWTFFATPQGGLGQPTVVLFDTADIGAASYSARFEAGQTNGIVTGAKYGGGIFQNVTLGAGQLNISLDIAASSPGVNGDGGTFELILDGSVVASHAFASMAPNQPQWSTLSYSVSVGVGVHNIELELLRGSFLQIGETPYQYLDNIQLSGTAVPEPSSAWFFLLGGSVVIRFHQKRTTLKLSSVDSQQLAKI